MKLKELRVKSRRELSELLLEKRAKIRSLRFETAAARIKNVRELRNTKKELARILTLLKAQEHAQNI